MDQDTTTSPPGGQGRRPLRILRRGIRLLLGPLVITATLFGLVYASAGTDTTSLDAAQPIDYWEECIGEGCSREEVKELWRTFNHECFTERCWMEEVGENAGTGIFKNQYGEWQYSHPHRVAQMMDYFVNRLGHTKALQVMIKPGPTDTFWARLVRQILKTGITVGIRCEWDDGGVHHCAGNAGL